MPYWELVSRLIIIKHPVVLGGNGQVMFFYLLLLVFIYVFYRVSQCFYRIFGQYFVPWNVTGQDSVKFQRLHAYVCKTELLDEISVNELYRFVTSMLHTEVTIKQFHKHLLSYKYAITCREVHGGSLRGVFFVCVKPRELDGQRYIFIRVGLTFFENGYQGGPLLYYVVAYHVLMQRLRYPRTPVYIAAKAFSYKSYLALVNSVKEVYPRLDAKTPPFIKKIIDNYALAVKHDDEHYDRESCVLKRELAYLKQPVAPISSADLSNPHIQFFNNQNPGWCKGHQLIMVARVTWSDLLCVLFKIIGRSRNQNVSQTDGVHSVN